MKISSRATDCNLIHVMSTFHSFLFLREEKTFRLLIVNNKHKVSIIIINCQREINKLLPSKNYINKCIKHRNVKIIM